MPLCFLNVSKQHNLKQVEKELLRVVKFLKEPKWAMSILNLYMKHAIKVEALMT